MLRASGLGLVWDGVAVVRGVDLTVRSGEFWALAGPNGAGKSTFLQAVLGTVAAAEASGGTHGAPAGSTSVSCQRTEMSATLPTTVREFVLLGLVGLRTTRKERAARLEWALAHAGLQGLTAYDFWTLSPHGVEEIHRLLASSMIGATRRDVMLFAGLGLGTLALMLRLLGPLLLVASLGRPARPAHGGDAVRSGPIRSGRGAAARALTARHCDA
jgi:ABC-type hemin transport system ATPase subunit